MEVALEHHGASTGDIRNLLLRKPLEAVRAGSSWTAVEVPLSHGTALIARYLSNRPSLTSQLASFNGLRFSSLALVLES